MRAWVSVALTLCATVQPVEFHPHRRGCGQDIQARTEFAQVSGQVASAGFVALIHLTAVLSVSIGLLNLFPIDCNVPGQLIGGDNAVGQDGLPFGIFFLYA